MTTVHKNQVGQDGVLKGDGGQFARKTQSAAPSGVAYAMHLRSIAEEKNEQLVTIANLAFEVDYYVGGARIAFEPVRTKQGKFKKWVPLSVLDDDGNEVGSFSDRTLTDKWGHVYDLGSEFFDDVRDLPSSVPNIVEMPTDAAVVTHGPDPRFKSLTINQLGLVLNMEKAREPQVFGTIVVGERGGRDLIYDVSDGTFATVSRTQ